MALKSSLAFDMLIQRVNYKSDYLCCVHFTRLFMKTKPEQVNADSNPDTCLSALIKRNLIIAKKL